MAGQLFNILQVALGLGFVIFVHELGHFLVAKACGVRCDKFFVGFDIGGYKLSRQWGETEYGIGILPLGGYVKMYGQEDNAANIEQELEEAKAMEGSPDAKEIIGPNGEKRWVHRRSYLAKSVPQRMAIISAGVIMNVIFAFIFAWFAYGFGVPEKPAVMGPSIPGSPVWEAGLRTGDRLVSINEIENPTYKQLVEQVILGDIESGIDCVVDRPGEGQFELNLKPRQQGLAPQIGFILSNKPQLTAKNAVLPNSPASRAEGAGFEDSDQIVEINGTTITTYADLAAVLVTNKSETLNYTLLRGGKPPADDLFGPLEGGQRVTATVEPNRMERLGIVPTLGPVTSIQADSPAVRAGLKVGDQILAVDGVAIGAAPNGQEAWDPMTLGDRLMTIASRGETLTVTIQRGDSEEPIEVEVTPRTVTWQTLPAADNAPIAYEAIGVACEIRAEIQAIVGGSPASEVDLRPGDRLLKVTLKSTNKEDKLSGGKLEIPLGEKHRDWPSALYSWQGKSSDLKVELLVARNQSSGANDSAATQVTHTVTLSPVEVDDAFLEPRGMRLQDYKQMKVVEPWGERTEVALEKTVGSLTQVLNFLQKLGGQISVKALGGPITIATEAGGAAYEGIGSLLMFLTMLSANLAVLNFLPIPVLDGGHMVFLIYEGITGRQVNERVMIILQTVGILFLLGLMLFVSTLDISRLLGMAW